jgi:methionyl-tRNA formyltransferase
MHRVAFFGSPAFAVPCLEALVRAEGVRVVGVFSQPDRPAGRGQQLRPPPVKEAAIAHGIEVLQPTRMKDGKVAAWLREQAIDLAVVTAYGRILPQDILDAPRLGCVNVHASLLPRWRGASPIQRAIEAGDAETGVCLMQMDIGLDTGAVLARVRLDIGPDETADVLAERLATAGADLLAAQLPALLAGQLVPAPQPEAGVTYAALLRKEDGRVDFSRPAAVIAAQVRAMTPWPGGTFERGGESWKLFAPGLTAVEQSHDATPGTVLAIDGEEALIATGDGVLRVAELQRPGRKRMGAGSALRGARIEVGARLDD